MKGLVAASPDNQKFPRSCDYVDCLHLFILSQQCHMTWLCWGINTGPLAADKTPLPIMHALSAADQNHILAMLDAGHTATKIAASTHYSLGTVSQLHSKYRPHLSKSCGGHPSKLSSANIHHAQHLISSGKADTAVDLVKTLSNITNQPLSAQTVDRKSVV